MSIETLRIVSQRLKPVERKIRQILRIGKVSSIENSNLSVDLSELESIKNAPFLAINGLQISPKVGDFVLVYSPEGRLEHSIALAVVSMGKAGNEHEVKLSAKDKTLGEILKEVALAIDRITSPNFFSVTGNVVTTSNAVTWKLEAGNASCENIKVSTEGFS
jgi:hypothetical protein